MANIQPQDQRINTNLQVVDYTPLTNTTIQTGAFRAQQEIAANTRKINRANKAMAEFKQKAEERQLTKEASAYIGKLGKSKDPITQQVMQSINVNTEDPKEVSTFIKTMGGPTEALKLINETADSTRKFQQDIQLEAFKQQGKAASSAPEAVYVKPADIDQYAKDNNIEITSTTPVQGAGGETVLKITGSKPAVAQESNINIPATETWAFDEDGKPKLGATKELDYNNDKVADAIQVVEQSSTGEIYVKTRDVGEAEKSLEDIRLEGLYEEAGKVAGKQSQEDINNFRKKAPTLQSNIYQYERMLTEFRSGKIKRNGFVEFFPDIGNLKKNLRSFVTPTNQDAIDRLTSVVFQNLRETLGAQFTAKEAQQFLDAAYNPNLKAEVNYARMMDAAALMNFAYEEQVKYINYLQTPAGMANPNDYGVLPIDAFKTYLNNYTKNLAAKDAEAGIPPGNYRNSKNKRAKVRFTS